MLQPEGAEEADAGEASSCSNKFLRSSFKEALNVKMDSSFYRLTGERWGFDERVHGWHQILTSVFY